MNTTLPSPIDPDRVLVRMYKKILGDCFLIMLEKDGHDTAHVMVDCGILQGTPNGGEIMRNVVTNVYQTTKGKPLDLVIVTHEHHDHISGFQYAKDVFEKHGLSALWMAWTEDPRDPDGIRLQKEFGDGFAILGALSHKLGMANPHIGSDEAATLGLVGFSGTLPAFDSESKMVKPRGSRAVYSNLYRWAGVENTRFLSPGTVLNTPSRDLTNVDEGTAKPKPALRTYVLGPPREMARLKNDLPSTVNPETYFGFEMGDVEAHLPVISGQAPFAKTDYWRTKQEIEAGNHSPDSAEALTKARYFAERSYGDYFDAIGTQSHRQIGNLDRSIFSSLALRMDSKTNNTSLVLAFELPCNAGVMLFAADAQVGNWKSWEDVVFREAPEAPPLTLTSDELLARTCLYKVGHHGSHNATLAANGLEKMHGRDFVSMIPTDAAFALEQGAGWLMPNPNVEAALTSKGRVLRGDRTAGTDARVTQTDLYVEYLVFDKNTVTQ